MVLIDKGLHPQPTRNPRERFPSHTDDVMND